MMVLSEIIYLYLEIRELTLQESNMCLDMRYAIFSILYIVYI